MQRRWGPAQWVLVGIALLIALTVGEIVLRSGGRDQASDLPPAPQSPPPFRIGEAAADFSLPDARGVYHRCSDLSREDTLLCFICGCSNCRDLQTYLGMLLRAHPPRTPHVVSVSTMPPESEAAWMRETRLPQTLLYEGKGGPIMKRYQGHPCPRFFRLGPGMRVAWISDSPSENRHIDAVGHQLAENLGFYPPELAGPGRPAAPRWNGGER